MTNNRLFDDKLKSFGYDDQKYSHSTFEYAIDYSQNKDLSVIPIKFKDKKPAVSSWEQYQKDKPSLEQIKEWFGSNDTKNNIAIITGNISRIVAFDIDGEEAERKFDEVIKNLDDIEIKSALNNTMQSKTGSGHGKHIIIGFNAEEFQNSGNIKTTTLWTGYGKHSEIKLKGEGGYIVVPPSLHISGNRYEFINKVKPSILTKEQICKLLSVFNLAACSYGDHENDDDDNNGKTKQHAIYRNLTTEEIEVVASKLKDFYCEGQRDEIIFGLGGLLFKHKISLMSAENLVSVLCDSTHDEEKHSRLQVINNTYLKGLNGEELTGSTQILEVLTRSLNGDKDFAVRILEDILQDLEDKDKKQIEVNDNSSGSSPTITQVLISLVRENALLFFKDQYDVAYAKIKVVGHSEIIALRSKKFEYYVSKLYFDYSQGEVASQESLNNAIRVLVGQTLFDSPTDTLNLRVAWGEEKDKEIYYDLADSEWQCIRITHQGWEIIRNSPALFTRFNQKAQLEPERNYSQDIFDKFFDLMHINDEGRRLLTKVWTISLLVPEFAHPINITFGEKGSSKSTFCRFVKRLIDPDKIELLTIPKNKSEFVQQLYHNYLTV